MRWHRPPFHALQRPSDPAARGGAVRWLVWANDHTFFIPTNLVSFISRLNSELPYFGGHEFEAGKRRFVSGAAGIILSAASLRLLNGHWSEPSRFPECFPPQHPVRIANHVPGQSTGRPQSSRDIPSFGKVKEPGLVLADCLHLGGVLPNQTLDEFARDRFHPYGPKRMVAGLTDDWYRRYHTFRATLSSPSPSHRRSFGDNFSAESNLGARNGSRCCAALTISFHYVEAAECRALSAVLSNQTDLVARRLSLSQLHGLWPQKASELGGYSRALDREDGPFWDFLLRGLNIVQSACCRQARDGPRHPPHAPEGKQIGRVQWPGCDHGTPSASAW